MTINLVSLAVSLTIGALVGKFKKILIDYTLVWVLTVKCVTTLYLVHLVENKASGFEQIDPKEIYFAIA